tara:strand:- start:21325 stop:21777 length:453 start_codon:yes stop_codon:yes gene_type:complete
MIRTIKKIDEDFIYHSWLHSVKCPTRAVSTMTRFLIDSLVEDKSISIWCPDDDENHIIGWIAHGRIENTPLLHFMFVKKAFRKNGVGKELLYNVYPDRKSPVFCTFWSHSMQVIDARRKWNAKFASNLLPAVIHTIHTKDNVQEVHRGAA